VTSQSFRPAASQLRYVDDVGDVPIRDLRNNTGEVTRRWESGEELTLTVNGNPIARIVPIPRRPRFLPWQQVLAYPADPGLADELRELVPDTTDDMDDPWERAARR
jgi:prevent-host-death family protein